MSPASSGLSGSCHSHGSQRLRVSFPAGMPGLEGVVAGLCSVLAGFRSQEYMVKPRGESSQLGRSQHRAILNFSLLGFPVQGLGAGRPRKQRSAPQRSLGCPARDGDSRAGLSGKVPPLGTSLPFLSSECAFLTPHHSGHAGVRL